MVSGKEFRISLRCPKPLKIRVVPAFSLQSLQRNTIVKWQGERSRPPVLKPSLFKYYYDREEFPIGMEVGKGNSFEKKIEWKVPPEKLDYHHYLPMFFDGLSEISYPCSFFALQGIYDFLDAAPHKVFPVVPQLIMPLKNALNTRNRQIIISTLKVIQHLVLSAEMVGEALVPYYRQLLPIFNIYKNDNVTTFDEVDFTAEKGENIGDLVGQTLELLERHGGEDAFINIKYMVPTYESCINN